jgi:hypothetical protein
MHVDTVHMHICIVVLAQINRTSVCRPKYARIFFALTFRRKTHF